MTGGGLGRTLWLVPRPSRSVWQVPRNDIDAARQFVLAQPGGQVTPAIASVLVKLQSKPDQINAVMRDEGWVETPMGSADGGEDGDVDPATDPVEVTKVVLVGGGGLLVGGGRVVR